MVRLSDVVRLRGLRNIAEGLNVVKAMYLIMFIVYKAEMCAIFSLSRYGGACVRISG